jgi:PAS domain S-box-containing protein
MSAQALTSPIRVLLLEDSALDAELIEVQLKAARLDYALDRVWTLDAFQQAVTDGRHDVILSDHLLRGFDGHDALGIARSGAPDVPFIFVSGTLSDELAVEALKQGARDYVVKQRLQRLPDAIVRALRENEERKRLAQAEQELVENRRRLLLMADALPALIAHLDLDHRYRFGNDAHSHWFGITPDVLPGMHVAQVIGAAAFEAMARPLAGVVAGERRVIEAAVPMGDHGASRYVQIDCVPEADGAGGIAGYYMLARDISELKDTELLLRQTNVTLERQVQDRTAELQRSQSRLSAIFESSVQLQILLAIDGTVLDANAASLAAIDVSKDDVVGQSLFLSPWFAGTADAAEAVWLAVDEAAAGASSRRELELKLATGLRSFDFSFRPLRDPSDDIVAIVIEAAETTARRQAEHALRQSQKIEAIGQLTGGIAHDFNNILTIIAGNAELAKLLIGSPGASDRAVRALDSALKGVASAAALTHRLLAFARRQPLKKVAVDCNRQILGMQDMLKRSLGELVELRVLPGLDMWPMEVDAAQLEAAILNLAVNARDAMPAGGRLDIETANAWLSEDDVAGFPEVAAGEYVMVRVTDTGQGMSRDTMARVFEPFFTTKEVGRGTGLGLPMVYGFVKQSDGHIVLDSTPGEGTSITMFFPRSTAEMDADEDEAPAERARDSRDFTILVAEDDDQVRAYVVEVLRDLGYRVLESHDGHSALRLLGRPDGQVDMLFSDVVMPGMAGWELARKARALQPDMAVLFTSGYPRNIEDNEREARDIGILAKPYTRSDLATAVARCLETRSHGL